MTSNVGMAWISNRRDSPGEVSTSTFTSLTLPARSTASLSSTGLTIRHGPHQAAQKSTRTGTEDCSATTGKSASDADTIQGRSRPQLPQRGCPAAAAGIRLVFPQCGHLVRLDSTALRRLPAYLQSW